jgi:hypothetical protein
MLPPVFTLFEIPPDCGPPPLPEHCRVLRTDTSFDGNDMGITGGMPEVGSALV